MHPLQSTQLFLPHSNYYFWETGWCYRGNKSIKRNMHLAWTATSKLKIKLLNMEEAQNKVLLALLLPCLSRGCWGSLCCHPSISDPPQPCAHQWMLQWERPHLSALGLHFPHLPSPYSPIWFKKKIITDVLKLKLAWRKMSISKRKKKGSPLQCFSQTILSNSWVRNSPIYAFSFYLCKRTVDRKPYPST